ncbi:glycosyltransferase [Lysobacter claricitrinus]|uniref:glycosyltransferase n=1 Tax=Lysobacter claricitrinus TaxID=3367728 RepID=UPI0038B2888C
MPESPHPQRSAAALLALFYARRGVGLALRGARRLVSGGLVYRPNGKGPSREEARSRGTTADTSVLIVDQHLPRPDVDSGSVRMSAIAKIFQGLGFGVSIIADDLSPGPGSDNYATPSFGTMLDVVRWLRARRNEIRLVILSRHTTASHWTPLIRELLPEARIVFDTVDLHYLRESRHASRVGSTMLELLARITRSRELDAVRATDCTWVVSPVEKTLLERECPESRVQLVSNIVDVLPNRPGFTDRAGYLFVGNFSHEPNVDAIEWLASWWPIVRAERRSVHLKVIGGGMPRPLKHKLERVDGIEVLGHVKDLESFLRSSRVMLAPLRYGAGVKGKINAAFAAGLPVVGTPCAMEGMIDTAAMSLGLGDTPESLARAAVRAHEDEALWQSLAEAGVQQATRAFSTAVAVGAICRTLGAIGVDQPSRR